ncbi:hypothetical protein ACQRE0_21765, partial [Victivallis vadensis]
AVGYKADVAAVSKMFGLPLTYEAPQQLPGMGMGIGPVGPTRPVGQEPPENALTPDKKAVMYGALIRGGVLTPTRDLEERVRAELGLDPLPEEAAKLWDEAGGVRKPLTLKDPAEPPPEAGQVGPVLELAELPEKPGLASALEAWLGPFADAAAEAAAALDDETIPEAERAARLRRAVQTAPGASGAVEKLMAGDMEAQQ